MNHHITEKRARDIVGINYIVVICVPINYREKKKTPTLVFVQKRFKCVIV